MKSQCFPQDFCLCEFWISPLKKDEGQNKRNEINRITHKILQSTLYLWLLFKWLIEIIKTRADIPHYRDIGTQTSKLFTLRSANSTFEKANFNTTQRIVNFCRIKPTAFVHVLINKQVTIRLHTFYHLLECKNVPFVYFSYRCLCIRNRDDWQQKQVLVQITAWTLLR